MLNEKHNDGFGISSEKMTQALIDFVRKIPPLRPRATSVVPTDDFELLLTFNNGEKRIFDAKSLFQYSMYEPLKNIGFF